MELPKNHSGGIDQLTDALGGLELCSSQQKPVQDVTTPASQARPKARSRQASDKENVTDGENGVTPSRLACFKQLRDELTCAVCLDVCVRPCTTPCGHNYCRSCLRRNLELNLPCPKCRTMLPPGFALNINTTLWNTIQHLFPSEANAKPLTPPQPQHHQATRAQAAARRAPVSASSNPAAAPFRPPRFVVLGASVAPPAFTGTSSSRANATPAGSMGSGGLGLASLSGRSVSGPRPQRQPHAAAGQEEGSVAAAISSAAARCALGPNPPLQLGTRGVREEARARRERRRSRSAERWEQQPLMTGDAAAAGAAASGDAAAAAAAGFSGAGTSAPTRAQGRSLLMQVLAELEPSAAPPRPSSARVNPPGPTVQLAGDRRAAVPSLAAASSISSNPFIRVPRPTLVPSGPGTSGAVGSAAAARDSQGVSAGARAVPAPAEGSAAGQAGFSASQRAMLGARSTSQGSARGASHSAASLTAARGRQADLTAPGAGAAHDRTEAWAAADTDATASDVSAASSARFVCGLRTGSSTSSSCPSSRANGSGLGGLETLDDASALDLPSDDCGRGWGPSASGAGGKSARGDPLAPRPLLGSLMGAARGSSDSRSGASQAPSAPATPPATYPSEGGGGILSHATTGGRAAAGPGFVLDEDVTLEGLDGLSPCRHAETGPQAVVGQQADDEDITLEDLDDSSSPVAGLVSAAGASLGAWRGPPSPTWEQLDALMAGAMQPLVLPPPSLPRLRLPARQNLPASMAAAQGRERSGAEGTVSQVPAPIAVAEKPLGLTAAAEQKPASDGGIGCHRDPDLSSNYDGEDPADADSFFNSPFFDRTMLEDTLGGRGRWRHDGADAGSDAGSEAGFSPTWAQRGPVPRLQPLDAAGEPLEVPCGTAGREGGTSVDATATIRGVGPLIGGLSAESEDALAGGDGARCALLRTRQAQEPGRGSRPEPGRAVRAGDNRDCPIELLSDSDEDGGVPAQSTVQQVARQQPSRQVVPGLRRPC